MITVGSKIYGSGVTETDSDEVIAMMNPSHLMSEGRGGTGKGMLKPGSGQDGQ